MNIALNREATADKSREATRKTNGQLEALTLDTAFSEAVRELAEKSVDQTREAYDRAKDALEAAVDIALVRRNWKSMAILEKGLKSDASTQDGEAAVGECSYDD